MNAYLDTHVVVWLAEENLHRLSGDALHAVNEYDLLVSPIVLVELAFLSEIRRIVRDPQAILRQLRIQLGLQICQHPFPEIAEAALDGKWTREPFDRLITAHAKANGYSPLITADEQIRRNYSRAIW